MALYFHIIHLIWNGLQLFSLFWRRLASPHRVQVHLQEAARIYDAKVEQLHCNTTIKKWEAQATTAKHYSPWHWCRTIYKVGKAKTVNVLINISGIESPLKLANLWQKYIMHDHCHTVCASDCEENHSMSPKDSGKSTALLLYTLMQLRWLQGNWLFTAMGIPGGRVGRFRATDMAWHMANIKIVNESWQANTHCSYLTNSVL